MRILSKKMLATTIYMLLSSNSIFASCGMTPVASCSLATSTSSAPCSSSFATYSALPTYPSAGCSNISTGGTSTAGSPATNYGNCYSGGCPTYTLTGTPCAGTAGSTCKNNSTCTGTFCSSTTYSCNSGSTVDYAWSCTSTTNNTCSFPTNNFWPVYMPHNAEYIVAASCPNNQKMTQLTMYSDVAINTVSVGYSISPSGPWTSVNTSVISGLSMSISPSTGMQTLFLNIQNTAGDTNEFAVTSITCS